MTDNVSLNEKERQELKAMLGEITHCMQRMDSEREAMADIAKVAEEKFKIKKKIIRKLANTMYKHDYSSWQQEASDFETLYETIVEGKKASIAA